MTVLIRAHYNVGSKKNSLSEKMEKSKSGDGRDSPVVKNTG